MGARSVWRGISAPTINKTPSTMNKANETKEAVIIGVTTEGEPLYSNNPLDCQTPNTQWYE